MKTYSANNDLRNVYVNVSEVDIVWRTAAQPAHQTQTDPPGDLFGLVSGAYRCRLRPLGISAGPTHNSSMYKLLHYERADYSVVVKNRASPKAWRWEIYRAGNANPIKHSVIYFDTIVSAKRAGKVALTELLNKLFS
jgi:hypothetical protein